MKKVKLAIVYQVIFHYRVPFYKEIEADEDFDATIIHGIGIEGTKIKNAKNDLKNTKLIPSLKVPFKQQGEKRYFSFFPFLFFSLMKKSPDVILIESTSVPNCISALLYAKLFRRKVIYWTLGKVKNKQLSYPRRKIDKLINYIEKKTDAIFAYSTLTKNYFIGRNINPDKIFVGLNVLDTREILKMKNDQIPKQDFRILFVGTIIPEKKLELLIEVFLKLENNYDNLYLDIVGAGADYYTKLKEKYEKTSSNLLFHGRQTEGLEEYYFKSNVFVLPGLGGLAISESMAYGVPVIASTADGTERDLIVNNKTGVFIEKMTRDALYLKLEELYKDRALLKQMGENAKKSIETKYSFENYYQIFKDSVHFVRNK